MTVLIVSYNTRDLLEGCLCSLQRASREADFDLIVVDNASADGSEDIVNIYFTDCKVIRMSRNCGFAAAVNRGLSEVSRPFTFILNPDTLIPGGTVGKLVAFLSHTPDAAVAGPSLTDSDGTPQTSTFKFPSLFREFFNLLPELKAAIRLRQAALRLGWAQPNPSAQGVGSGVPVQCVSGAAMMVRTEAVRQVGGLDERFFLYHEEMDLCTRLRRVGWGVYLVPEAHVIHWEARASGFLPHRLPQQPLLGWRLTGMDLLWRKHRPGLPHRLWRAQTRFLIWIRIVGNAILFCLPFASADARRSRARRIRELREVVSALGNSQILPA